MTFYDFAGASKPCSLRKMEYGNVCVCNSTYCDTFEDSLTPATRNDVIIVSTGSVCKCVFFCEMYNYVLFKTERPSIPSYKHDIDQMQRTCSAKLYRFGEYRQGHDHSQPADQVPNDSWIWWSTHRRCHLVASTAVAEIAGFHFRIVLLSDQGNWIYNNPSANWWLWLWLGSLGVQRVASERRITFEFYKIVKARYW